MGEFIWPLIKKDGDPSVLVHTLYTRDIKNLKIKSK